MQSDPKFQMWCIRGMQLCVMTNEKRLAFLTVKNVMKLQEDLAGPSYTNPTRCNGMGSTS